MPVLPTKALTDSRIGASVKKSAAAKVQVELSDVGERGLRLRISPGGTCTWVLGMRDSTGRLRRFRVGDYPTVGISEARVAARRLFVQVKDGAADPIAEARRKRTIARDAADGVGTLTALLALYEMKRGADLRSWPDQRRAIANVFAKHLDRPMATMTMADLQMSADAHKARMSASLAVRCLRPVLKWAIQRSFAPPNLADLHPPITVRRRDRVLSRSELAAVLPVLKASDRPHAGAILFMLLTLARREEVGAATWGAVDLGARKWTIPQTKSGRAHQVPLSDQAMQLLRSIRPKNPADDALLFATKSGRRLSNWDRETRAIAVDAGMAAKPARKGKRKRSALWNDGIPPWTRHDLRRTGATILGELGTDPHVIEAALNHVAIHSQIASVYNRSRYLPQVAEALQRLANWLDGVVGGGAQLLPPRGNAA